MFRIYSFLAHTQFRKVYKTITQQHPIIVFLYYRVQSQDAICDFEVIQLLLILFALSTKVCYSKWNTSIYNYFLYIWLRYVHRLSLTLPTLTLTLFLSLFLCLHIFIFSRISKSKSLVVLASKDHESECYGNSLQTFGAFEIYENDVWTLRSKNFNTPYIIYTYDYVNEPSKTFFFYTFWLSKLSRFTWCIFICIAIWKIIASRYLW